MSGAWTGSGQVVLRQAQDEPNSWTVPRNPSTGRDGRDRSVVSLSNLEHAGPRLAADVRHFDFLQGNRCLGTQLGVAIVSQSPDGRNPFGDLLVG